MHQVLPLNIPSSLLKKSFGIFPNGCQIELSSYRSTPARSALREMGRNLAFLRVRRVFQQTARADPAPN